jgi:serine O-acetyltransferase
MTKKSSFSCDCDPTAGRRNSHEKHPSGLVRIIRTALEDLDVVVDRDPSVENRWEALLHPSIMAVWSYRYSRRLYLSGRRLRARAVMVAARVVTGIELHPGARVGRRFFVDHGLATVIGGTCVIGDDVTLFHQVTLGAVGFWKDRRRAEGERRHPRLEDGVVVGANATVLGPVTIGERATVGAHAMVVTDVDPGTRVRATGSPQHAKEPKTTVTKIHKPRRAPQTVCGNGNRALVAPEGGWTW